MEERASTPNGGSKKNSREGYSKAKVENVSENKINKLLDKSVYGNFSLNSMAISWSDNVKTIGGEEKSESISYGELEFDKNVMIENSVVISLRNVTEKNEKRIKSVRNKKKEAAVKDVETEERNN